LLRISALPLVHYYYTVFDLGNQAKVGEWPALYEPMPRIIFVTASDYKVPQLVTEEFQLGWMSQGTKEWGALRDKDVHHLGIDGSIICNSKYLETQYPNDLIVPWGTDVSWELTRGLVSHNFVSQGQTHRVEYVSDLNTSVSHTISVSFTKNACLVKYRRTKMAWKDPYYFDPNYLNGDPEFYILKWFLRGEGPSGHIYQTLSFQGQAADFYSAPVVNLPIGSKSLSLVTDAWFSNYQVGVDAISTTATTATDTGGQDVSLIRQQQIVQSMSRPGYTWWAWQNFMLYPDPLDVSILGADILRSFKYVDASLLLTMFDLARAYDDIESWKNLSRAFGTLLSKSKRVLLKELPVLFRTVFKWSQNSSRAYLGVKYGILPTYRDIAKLVEGVTKLNNLDTIPQRVHARRTSTVVGLKGYPVTTTSVLTVEMAQLSDDFLGKITSVIREGKRWGIYPSLTMLWDVVPYSFVLDWFVNLSSTFNDVQQYNDKEYFPIYYCIESQKRVWSPPLAALWPTHWASGKVQFKYYYRSIADELPLPPVQVGIQIGSFSHWAESTALVIQRIH